MLVSTVGTVLERFHSKPKVNNTQRSGLIIVIRLTRAYSYIKHTVKIFYLSDSSPIDNATEQVFNGRITALSGSIVRKERISLIYDNADTLTDP